MRRALRSNRKLEKCHVKPAPVAVHVHMPVTPSKDTAAEEDKESRNDHYNRLQDNHRSGEEKYDAAILTMAPALLGLSITFMKDVVKLADARWIPMLYWSWALLALATLFVVASFRFSSIAMHRDMVTMAKVWNDPYTSIQCELNDNRWNTITKWINHIAGVSFVAGLILMAIFVGNNETSTEKANMSKNNQQQGQLQQRGLTTPPMRPASTPAIPASPPAVQPGTSQGNGSGTGNTGGQGRP